MKIISETNPNITNSSAGDYIVNQTANNGLKSDAKMETIR